MYRVALPFLLVMLSAFGAASGMAAPVGPNRNAKASVEIANPSTLQKLEDLNFASLGVVGAGGTAIVNPNTNALTTTGGVVHVAGASYAAKFRGIAPKKTVVIIRIPKDPITITRVGGTETMTVSNWTLSGSDKRNVPAKEAFDFQVGGTLTVNAGQVEGTYIGTFNVQVQYP